MPKYKTVSFRPGFPDHQPPSKGYIPARPSSDHYHNLKHRIGLTNAAQASLDSEARANTVLNNPCWHTPGKKCKIQHAELVCRDLGVHFRKREHQLAGFQRRIRREEYRVRADKILRSKCVKARPQVFRKETVGGINDNIVEQSDFVQKGWIPSKHRSITASQLKGILKKSAPEVTTRIAGHSSFHP